MLEQLLSIIGDPGRVVLRDIEEKYLTDTLGRLKGTAAALVFPVTKEEVSGVLRFACENGLSVTPRGAGTNLVGSTVPHGGIILDLSRMNRILALDRENLTVSVEPGVLLQDLQAYVEAQGLFYPPDPGEKTASIGGTIATNAGGMRAVKYGVTRDYVRGLTVALADGTLMTVGSKCVKDASGLQLKQLLIGSEGTLAVTVECLLRLIPKPETTLSVLVPFGSLEKAVRAVPEILRAGVNPTAVEFIERSVAELGEQYAKAEFPARDAAAYILLSLDGEEESVARAAAQVEEIAYQAGAKNYIPLRDPKLAADVWRVRGALVKAVEEISEQEPVDLVVPLDKIAAFIDCVNEAQKETGVKMVAFGHAGDGNIHLCVLRGRRDADTWEKTLANVMTVLYDKAYALGGVASGEHGIGLAKRPYFLKHTAPVNLRVMRAVKDALDEKHILNDHISYLK